MPIQNVSGRVVRVGAPAPSLDLELRDPTTNVEIASTESADGGEYGFEAPVGTWEVKIKGEPPGDFDSVTRQFTIPSERYSLVLPPLEISAGPARLRAPADAATLGLPIPSAPMTFRWYEPTRAYSSARVQVFHASGAAFWYSEDLEDSTTVWDGVGNQGLYTAASAGAGTYAWRVKFVFPDTSEARTRTWRVEFE